MKIAFRTDASLQIGTGHVMRCLTLADALRESGAKSTFFCRAHSGNLLDLIAQRGYDAIALPPADKNASLTAAALPSHAPWLGTDWASDVDQMKRAMADRIVDWLIIDHYALDINWEKALRTCTRRIMVIDDLADRPHDCDLLLDQNWHKNGSKRYKGKVPAKCKMLLGPTNALLREEFLQYRNVQRPRSGGIRRILVFYGGVDAENHTMKAIRVLKKVNVLGLRVDVVIGKGHQYREQIFHECLLQGFDCHVQAENMAELMSNADLAIGAGGGALWERCAVGLPAIVSITAENQRESILALADEGAVFLSNSMDMENEIRNILTSLIDMPERLDGVSKCGRMLMKSWDRKNVVRALITGWS